MSMVDSHEKQCGDTGEVTTEDRSSAIAVLVFPVLMIVGAIIAYQTPETFVGFKPYLNPMLMFIMFAMGLTITPPDLKEVARRPWPIVLGVVCQFIVMPLSAVAISSILGFDQSLTIGLILLGSVPGGTASNVLAYLAKGDVALSVAMTSVSTLVSPFATPLIMLLLAGESAEVNASGMMASLLKTVLIPVGFGLILRFFAQRFVDAVLPVLPRLSIVVIGIVMMTVVAGAHAKLATVGIVVVLGVAIQNFIGFIAGYWSARAVRQPEASCRTTSIEVATQNSGLAASMATQFFTPEAALPGAVATIYANISGAIYAAIVRRKAL
ncbi:bile acid:sodium symporter family protein [Corynebacterium diphtheriae bv. mitis]|uniref:bile acid:sodium symporter family protein n=1 Tax=Corynebacterium diphtheriae TaxID=1717 RepID=UPI0018CB7066|nr:bile acid:sodium symporter family protein [Corynebacterium diphtheriae]MBG9246509.1 bile acid:sodium symporter family protein [Corynebacterium diphtheriae bv. mitis]